MKNFSISLKNLFFVQGYKIFLLLSEKMLFATFIIHAIIKRILMISKFTSIFLSYIYVLNIIEND